MKSLIFFSSLLCIFLINSCQGQAKDEPKSVTSKTKKLIDPSKSSISTRFLAPEGFERIEEEPQTYASYLRDLPLKSIDAEVKHYDGTTKPNNGVYVSVVDKEIGKRDLHQCADAIMRLRAEYLWEKKAYDEIHFNFTNGFRVDYTEWMKGRRVVVKGHNTYWNDRSVPLISYEDFWRYMEVVFAYAGTLSLEKELKAVDLPEMKIGDVFIQGGTPGHAVVVVDMAKNPDSGKQVFILAQSYMPAQEIQILSSSNSELSPWYELEEFQNIRTPEWTFYRKDLKRF